MLTESISYNPKVPSVDMDSSKISSQHREFICGVITKFFYKNDVDSLGVVPESRFRDFLV